MSEADTQDTYSDYTVIHLHLHRFLLFSQALTVSLFLNSHIQWPEIQNSHKSNKKQHSNDLFEYISFYTSSQQQLLSFSIPSEMPVTSQADLNWWQKRIEEKNVSR